MTINALPPFTTADIPDAMRNKMSPAARAEYVKKQNEVRGNAVASAQLLGLTYPHEITFSDAGLSQFQEINHRYPMPKTYRLGNKALTLNYGEISSSDANTQTLLSIDYGGAIHHRCERIVKDQTPDIYKKIADARRYQYVGELAINPDWQPKK